MPGPAAGLEGGRPLFGLDVPYADETAIETISASLQRAPVLVSQFVKLDSTFSVRGLRRTADDGRRVPVVTLEPWSYVSRSGDVDQPAYALERVADGSHDAALRRVIGVLAGYGGPVLVRFAHEMNADWYPWAVSVNGNSAAAYVAAWRHVHALVRAAAPNVSLVWAPVAAWWENSHALGPLYPGDDYVDFVGVTGYGRGGSAEQTLGAWWREVRTITDKRAVLTEIGASGPDKVGWIRSLAEFLNAHDDVGGFVWFNTAPETTGATGDYRIDDSTDHTAAFREMLAAADVVCLEP